MKLKILCLLLLPVLLLPVLLLSCSKTPTSTIDYSKKFNTVDECGISMTQKAMSLTKKYEYGGVCIQGTDKKFYGSIPVTHKEIANVKYKLYLLPGTKIAAIYHTHPEGEYSTFYSNVDVLNVKKMKVLSYLGIMQDKTIRVFKQGFYVKTCDLEIGNFTIACADGFILKTL